MEPALIAAKEHTRNKVLDRIGAVALSRLMEDIDTSTITHAILASPDWARASLAAPSTCLRQQAAEELARRIIEQVRPSVADADQNQLGLDL